MLQILIKISFGQIIDKMEDFNCSFDAPMFVDFQNMDEHQEQEQAEAYFEVDHEPDMNNRFDILKPESESFSSNIECDTNQTGLNAQGIIDGEMDENVPQVPLRTVARGEQSKNQTIERVEHYPADSSSQVSPNFA